MTDHITPCCACARGVKRSFSALCRFKTFQWAVYIDQCEIRLQFVFVLDPIAHTSVGGWLSKKSGRRASVSPLPHFCVSLFLDWPQLPADRPCVRDQQHVDTSWFNYVLSF